MPRLPEERPGRTLAISGRPVDFSFWPTAKQNRGYTLQTEILSNTPWDVIEFRIKQSFNAGTFKYKACLSFLEQAKTFFFASETYNQAARPLLLYYSFLNLAKCFILFKGTHDDLDNAEHGLSVKKAANKKSQFTSATIAAYPATAKHKNVFDLFGQALGNATLPNTKTYKVIKHVIPQIVIGHRLWIAAARKTSQFARCERIELRHSKKSKLIWIRLAVRREDIQQCKVSHSNFLKRTKLSATFREVKPNRETLKKTLVFYEQKTPIAYTRRPSDRLHLIIKSISHRLWQIIRSVPPYRRYYLNLMSPENRRLHPILSVYALCFYFGSVTRYRPYEFENIQNSNYGMLVAEFLSTQGYQFWFLMASEFSQQSISLPAVAR